MKIAIEGCAHGELNKIYESIQLIEHQENIKVDLLICCGDFQSVRDKEDMRSMAVPDKYMHMKDFWEYYTGKKTAPILTIFIGGNHEASSYLWELPYGGWVAENIYYMGFCSVVNFAGLRIGGVSGIFKKHDYCKDHFEIPPFSNDTKRSFYHVRKKDIEKMKLTRDCPPDVILSHDWPTNIYHHGNKAQLLKFKPFLRDEIESSTLGNEGAEELLNHVQPRFWFSGHMHAKFAALVQHPSGRKTKFLALDKCLPKRKFLQILDMGGAKDEAVLKYDLYWLGILKTTNDSKRGIELTDDYIPSHDILESIQQCHGNLYVLPFTKSQKGQNAQTRQFCERFGLFNPCETLTWKSIKESTHLEQDVVKDDDKLTDISFVQKTPRSKMHLPKPGTGNTTTPKKSPGLVKKVERDDDEFGELKKPGSVLNELDLSLSSSGEESSSESSSSGNSSDSGGNMSSDEEDKIKIGSTSKVSKLPSFIETPVSFKAPLEKCTNSLRQTSSSSMKSNIDRLEKKEVSCLGKWNSPKEINSVTHTSDLGSDLSAKESGDTEGGESETGQTPVKKPKIIRRNQNIYTPTKE